MKIFGNYQKHWLGQLMRDFDFELRGEDLELDLWREDFHLQLDSDCEDLITSLVRVLSRMELNYKVKQYRVY